MFARHVKADSPMWQRKTYTYRLLLSRVSRFCHCPEGAQLYTLKISITVWLFGRLFFFLILKYPLFPACLRDTKNRILATSNSGTSPLTRIVVPDPGSDGWEAAQSLESVQAWLLSSLLWLVWWVHSVPECWSTEIREGGGGRKITGASYDLTSTSWEEMSYK